MPSTRISQGIAAGHIAAVASAFALVALGWMEKRRPAGPLNGPSQWLWDTPAAEVPQASLQYTAVGYAVHHAMSVFWGIAHAHAFPRRNSESACSIMTKAAATAAFACFADYRLVPRRFQPGFDRQLSRTALLVVYAAFASGLAAAGMLGRNK